MHVSAQELARDAWAADVRMLGPDGVRDVLVRVIDATRPAVVTIDAYGVPAPAEAEAACAALLARSPRAGGSGVKVDATDPTQRALLLTWAPYSADVHVGRSGYHDAVLDLTDGEAVVVTATPDEAHRWGLDLDPARWRPVDRTLRSGWPWFLLAVYAAVAALGLLAAGALPWWWRVPWLVVAGTGTLVQLVSAPRQRVVVGATGVTVHGVRSRRTSWSEIDEVVLCEAGAVRPGTTVVPMLRSRRGAAVALTPLVGFGARNARAQSQVELIDRWRRRAAGL